MPPRATCKTCLFAFNKVRPNYLHKGIQEGTKKCHCRDHKNNKVKSEHKTGDDFLERRAGGR